MGEKEHELGPSWITMSITYFNYGLLFVLGYIRDFFNHIFKKTLTSKKGYAPLVNDFEDFYTRRMYTRIQDAWNRPIKSAPGAWIEVMDRDSADDNRKLTLNGKSVKCLNLGSYNYLGFGDPDSPCKPQVLQALENFGVATSSVRTGLGTTTLHKELEELTARFVGKEDAMVFGMGFGTNGVGIPSLVGKGCLIISDALNHSSIVFGSRASGAKVKVFRHNDVDHLERTIRRAIIDGQPRTRRPWKKILIVVEGIYSMEGEVCPLAEIVKIKKKYNCYLYLDEAHSIGAMGKQGRGMCQFANVNPDDVDLLMGTFTKSFGGVGGYIASDKHVISHLRETSAGSCYSASIAPAVCQQIISAIRIVIGEDGTDLGQTKIQALHDNANYFRRRMMAMGCHVLGDWDSPVVPIMLYNPGKIIAFSRECYKLGIAVVVVGFPAAPLLLARARVCLSAAHSRKDLDDALDKLEDVADRIHIRYEHRPLIG